MRKSELRVTAERGTETIIIYKAMQYRWEGNETADPQIGDVSYHLTKEEAIKAAGEIKLNIGFYPMVDQIEIDYDDFNAAIEFGEEFEFAELDNYRKFNTNGDTIWTGAQNEGKLLDPDAIIVTYRHHRYMNYSYDIQRVDFVRNTRLKTEADLRNDRDTTSAHYFAQFDDIDELANAFENDYFPFDKINSGSGIVREFLGENGHQDYAELTEDYDK